MATLGDGESDSCSWQFGSTPFYVQVKVIFYLADSLGNEYRDIKSGYTEDEW